MKILVAEDDPISRRLLEVTLVRWGFDVVMACDGTAAWGILKGEDPPSLAILDWMMPGLEGVEICRKIRETPSLALTYVLLLTAKDLREDVIAGLTAGANDYLTKPFNREELQARLRVGAKVVGLQTALAARVRELEGALSRVRQLQGLLPICAYCKKIRSDGNYWQQVENYIAEHTDAHFSHGICPDCYTRFIQPELDQMSREVATEAAGLAEEEGPLQAREPGDDPKGGI
jgi:sigma-B regulation protein RsbU (phosphoserine phosphatase)